MIASLNVDITKWILILIFNLWHVSYLTISVMMKKEQQRLRSDSLTDLTNKTGCQSYKSNLVLQQNRQYQFILNFYVVMI